MADGLDFQRTNRRDPKGAAVILTRVSMRRAMRLSGATSPTDLWRKVQDIDREQHPAGCSPDHSDSGLFRKYSRGLVCPRRNNRWFKCFGRWPGAEAPHECGLLVALRQEPLTERAVQCVFGRYQHRNGLWEFPNDAKILAHEERPLKQLQRDLHFYWMARGDDYGLGMLALTMRLTIESESSQAEKESSLYLFMNAANAVRTDPDFAPDTSALMHICFENMEASQVGRNFVGLARNLWQFFTSLPQDDQRTGSIVRGIDWARRQFPRIDRRHSYHSILLRRQERVPM